MSQDPRGQREPKDSPGRRPDQADEAPSLPGAAGQGRVPLTGEAQTGYEDAPPAPPEEKRIHPRRPLPPVPEGSARD
jgi:hypothetical protein